MGRSSGLVVGAVVVLAVVAAVDTVRGRSSSAPARMVVAGEAGEIADREPLARALAAQGVRGVLTYSDRNDDCRLRALSLPDLAWADAPRASSCRFALSPDRRRVLLQGAWRSDGRLGARCGRGRRSVEVVSAGGADLYSLGFGCPLAWHPLGSLTAVDSGGAVVSVRLPCEEQGARACAAAVIAPSELAALLPIAYPRLGPRSVRSSTAVRDLIWLSERRLAVLLDLRRRGSLALGVAGLHQFGTLLPWR